MGSSQNIGASRVPLGPGYRTDSPSSSTTDLIGVTSEIQAFARLAAARSITPPLAIGVFGDWGSGKSFFMNGVRRSIDDLARQKSDAWHRNVVQIEFNAWHYIETNLWASLVEYIFSKMEEWLRQRYPTKPQDIDRLFENLATSRALKLDTARAVVAAKLDMHKAQAAAAHARAELKQASVSVKERVQEAQELLLKQAAEDAGLKAVRARLAALGFGALAASNQDLKGALEDLRSEGGRAKLLWGSLRPLLGSGKAWLAIASLLLIPIALALLTFFFNAGLDHYGLQLSQILVGLSGGGATLAAIIHGLVKHVSAALNTVEQAHSDVTARMAELEADATKAQAAALADAEKQARAAEELYAQEQARLAAASAAAADAHNQYKSESARGRLNRFIRDRLADGTYGKHLGLIATIRKDFEQLTGLMDQAAASSDESRRFNEEEAAYQEKVKRLIAEATPDGQTCLLDAEQIADLKASHQSQADPINFERIILYIDDLDRCPPGKVVDVIQAVHMLLAFRLFVVFVAVDARWVSKALTQTFGGLLGKTEIHAAAAETVDSATAANYMEKIFQIPYWVRPLTTQSASKFTEQLASQVNAAHTSKDNAKREADAEFEDISAQDTPDAAALAEPDANIASPNEALPRAIAPPPPEPEPAPEPITLSSDEIRILSLYAGAVVPSPRTAKRYLNSYILIRTIVANALANDPDQQVDSREGTIAYLHQHSSELSRTVALAEQLARSIGLKDDSAMERIYQELVARDTIAAVDIDIARAFYQPIARRYSFTPPAADLPLSSSPAPQ